MPNHKVSGYFLLDILDSTTAQRVTTSPILRRSSYTANNDAKLTELVIYFEAK